MDCILFLYQVVALVHTLMSHKDVNMQRVLVVAPLNTVLNWQVEFDKWLSVDDRLEVNSVTFPLYAIISNVYHQAICCMLKERVSVFGNVHHADR